MPYLRLLEESVDLRCRDEQTAYETEEDPYPASPQLTHPAPSPSAPLAHLWVMGW